jgi:hypothetical protein
MFIYNKIYLFLLVFMWVYSHKRNVAIDDKKKKKNGVCIAKFFCVCEIEKLSVLCIEIVSAKK